MRQVTTWEEAEARFDKAPRLTAARGSVRIHNGQLEIDGAPLATWSVVEGDLFLDEDVPGIREHFTLADGLAVTGSLVIVGTGLTRLPEFLVVEEYEGAESLYILDCPRLKAWPRFSHAFEGMGCDRRIYELVKAKAQEHGCKIRPGAWKEGMRKAYFERPGDERLPFDISGCRIFRDREAYDRF